MGTQQCFATWELGGTLNAVAVARAPNATTTTQVEPHANETGTEGKVMFVAAEDGHLHAFDLRSRAAVRSITPSQRFVHTKLTEYTQIYKCAAGAPVNCVKATGASVSVGTDAGATLTWDMRAPSVPRHTLKLTAAPVTALALVSEGSGWAAGGDGLCWRWREGEAVTTYLSGPDCDSLHAVGVHVRAAGLDLYTAGRDGLVRSYRVSPIAA